MKRFFSPRQKKVIYQIAKGKCQQCGNTLGTEWHADHITPHSKGGKTEISNGQALCPSCNIQKSDKMNRKQFNPRKWQRMCMAKFQQKADQPLFAVGAVPGAGKSLMAAWMAEYCVKDLGYDFLVVISPQGGKKSEWVSDFYQFFGLKLQSNYSSGAVYQDREFNGVVLTYAGLNDRLESDLRDKVRNRKTLVIADEPHHLSESDGSAWGMMFKSIFQAYANKIIYLSGTYWREDKAPIPLLPYDHIKGEYILDFVYTYTDGITNGNNRKIEFRVEDPEIKNFTFEYQGEQHCFTGLLSEMLNEYGEEAINLCYSYLVKNHYSKLLPIAQKCIDQLERVKNDPALPMKNAKMAIWAPDITTAEAITKDLQKIGVYDVVLVHSQDPDAHNKLSEFKNSNDRVIVTVGIFSEGIDIPTTRVGLYLGISKTRLHWTQLCGREIRVTQAEYLAFQNKMLPEPLYSYMYLLAHPTLVEYTKLMEKEMGAADLMLEERQREEREMNGNGSNSSGDRQDGFFDLEDVVLNDGMSVVSRGNEIQGGLYARLSRVVDGLNPESEYQRSVSVEELAAIIQEQKQTIEAKVVTRVEVDPMQLREDYFDQIANKCKYIGIRISGFKPLARGRAFQAPFVHLRRKFGLKTLDRKKCNIETELLGKVAEEAERLAERLENEGRYGYEKFFNQVMW